MADMNQTQSNSPQHSAQSTNPLIENQLPKSSTDRPNQLESLKAQYAAIDQLVLQTLAKLPDPGEPSMYNLTARPEVKELLTCLLVCSSIPAAQQAFNKLKADVLFKVFYEDRESPIRLPLEQEQKLFVKLIEETPGKNDFKLNWYLPVLERAPIRDPAILDRIRQIAADPEKARFKKQLETFLEKNQAASENSLPPVANKTPAGGQTERIEQLKSRLEDQSLNRRDRYIAFNDLVQLMTEPAASDALIQFCGNQQPNLKMAVNGKVQNDNDFLKNSVALTLLALPLPNLWTKFLETADQIASPEFSVQPSSRDSQRLLHVGELNPEYQLLAGLVDSFLQIKLDRLR